jgi:muramoyltetrapeptide carboxypeptidase
VALGSWQDCGDPAELDSVFAARLGPLGVPVLAGVPAGHGPRQLTLELGAPAVLTVSPHSPHPPQDPHPAVPEPGALTLQAPTGGAR